jgi:hypothetical protein
MPGAISCVRYTDTLEQSQILVHRRTRKLDASIGQQ